MWTRADNYDARSRNPFCSVTGLPKLPEETGIFRLADIEFEGSFDIGEQVVRDMAAELGMAAKAPLEQQIDYLRAQNEQLQRDAAEKDSLILNLQRENAHLVLGIEEIELMYTPEEV